METRGTSREIIKVSFYKIILVGLIGCAIFSLTILLLTFQSLGFNWDGSRIQLISAQPAKPTATWSLQQIRFKAIDAIDAIAAAHLPIIDSYIGNCADYTVYQLSRSYTLVINDNACYEKGVYILGP